MKRKPLTYGTDMFALTFLVAIHVAHSYIFEEVTLPDFDEVEVFDTEGKPDTAKDFELKRLHRRMPRKAGGKGLDTEVLMIESEKIVQNEAESNDFETKPQTDLRELVFRNLKKVGAALSIRNPFFVSKNYTRDRNLFHTPTSLVDVNVQFKIVTPLATPYTRSNWEPNFLRNFIEHE